MTQSIEEAMRESIRAAEKNNTPFGAALIDREGVLIEIATNTAKADGPTAHAEMNVLHDAFKNHGSLSEFRLITTCEPCPMCMGGIIWSGIPEVYYGISIEEAGEFLKQIHISSEEIAKKAFFQPKIQGGVLRNEVISLFR